MRPNEDRYSLTSGGLAIVNLQAQIEGVQRRIEELGTAVGECAELIDLIALRGLLLGSIRDYESSATMAEHLVSDAPSDSRAFFTRARARGRFHRFSEALGDLDVAQSLGMDGTTVQAERASVFQSVGRYEDALSIFDDLARRRPDFDSLAALATFHADRQDIASAEQMFDASGSAYRGVSPFSPALLDFQRGHMWMTHGDLPRALRWFGAAVAKLPCYAAACGHLAEVEAALGDNDAAIGRLLPLATSSDDPDFAASLARVLRRAGRTEESNCYRNFAAARYDELTSRHPEAYADHAAEFWLEEPANRERALRFALMNLEIRKTPRAQRLLARASRYD